MQLSKSILVALSIVTNAAMAAPVEFDTKAAHIIVIRSLDSWSGDESVSEETLTSVRSKLALYNVATTSAKTGKEITIFGGAGLFGVVRDHPLTKAVQTELTKRNAKLAQSGYSSFNVLPPVSIPPSEMIAVTQVQAEYFRQIVVSQGDPLALASKVKVKKFIGGVLSIGSTLLAMDKFGAVLGSSATLGSGITNDIYAIATKNRAAIAPINLPNLDFSQYKSIDVRKILGAADRAGQIIIAYKEEKTPEAEQEALVLAIVSAAGADTTAAEVEKSRAEDLVTRIAIWDACVLAGQCKKD